MGRYRYEAMTATGARVAGEIAAESSSAAVAELRGSGLFVLECALLGDDSGGDAADSPPGHEELPQPRSRRRLRVGRNGSGGSFKPWLLALALGLFTLGGLFFAGLGGRYTWKMSRQLANARQTTGVVRSATIEEQRVYDDDGSTTYYVPRIQYSYAVAGQTHFSDQLYPGGLDIRTPSQQSRSSARGLVQRYQPGGEIAVWYLPDEPEASFLVRRRLAIYGLMDLLGGILAAVGLACLLPVLISGTSARFCAAAVVFFVGLAFAWLVLSAFLTAPREAKEITSPLLGWMLAAYLTVCWTAFVVHCPPSWQKLRDATFAALLLGILPLSLSVFVFVPLSMLKPDWNVLRFWPWVGVAGTVAGLIGWMTGTLAIGKPPGEGETAAERIA